MLLLFVVCACGSGEPSDEDLLEQFVKDVTGHVDEGLVTRSLGYTELANLPIEVRAPGHRGVYRQDQAEDLQRRFRDALRARFWNSEVRVRSKTITIDGDQAEVNMRLFSEHGPFRADVGLQKLASGWKVNKVHLSRGF